MEGATVQTRFTADTKDFDTKTKSVSSKISSIASSVAKGIAVATGVATVAVGKMVSDSVKSFAEYEQLEGGLESLFGKGSEEMNKILQTSETAYKDLTMSQNDYLKSFEGTYSIMKNGLGENADAIEYTNKMISISSDLYNTYGGSVEQYSNAINWALKGTYSYIDNLNIGIKGTQEGFIEAANSSGVLGREIKDVSDLTNDEIIDVIEFYANSAGAIGKTQKEASTTIQGSLNMMKSSWQDLQTQFAKGGDLSKPIDNFIQSAKTFADQILPIIETVLISISKALPGLVDKINEILPGLIEGVLPSLIQAVVSLVNGLIKALPSLIKTLLPPLIEGLLSITTEIIKLLPDTIIMIAEMLPSLMPQIIDAILSIIPMLIDNLPLFLSAGARLLGGLIAGIVNSIPILLARIGEIVVKMINSFKTIDLKQIGKDILKGLWNGLSSMKDWVVEKVKGIGKSILSGLKGILGIKSPSKEFAIIGRYSILGYTEALDDMQSDVQKQIAETFSISPQLSASSGMHFSPNIINNNYVDIQQDPLGQMVNSIKTYSGGAKNDFNYGAGL